MEVQLPATIKTKLMGQMLVQKERGFIQVLRGLGEWQTPISKPISSFHYGKSPIVLSKTKTKASAQSSCSILKHSPLEPAGGC